MHHADSTKALLLRGERALPKSEVILSAEIAQRHDRRPARDQVGRRLSTCSRPLFAPAARAASYRASTMLSRTLHRPAARLPHARSFTSSPLARWTSPLPSLAGLPFDVAPEVAQAKAEGRAIVALESTLVTHGESLRPPSPSPTSVRADRPVLPQASLRRTRSRCRKSVKPSSASRASRPRRSPSWTGGSRSDSRRGTSTCSRRKGGRHDRTSASRRDCGRSGGGSSARRWSR